MAGPGIWLASAAPGRTSCERGFTAVELIVVMILVGILGAVGAARFFDSRPYEVDAFAQQTRALLRYAQKHAIAQNQRPVCVMLEADRISLRYFNAVAGSCAGQVLAPPGANNDSEATRTHCASTTWYCLGRPPSITYSVSGAGNAFMFDALGRPVNLTGAELVLAISGNGPSETVRVAEETGYVF